MKESAKKSNEARMVFHPKRELIPLTKKISTVDPFSFYIYDIINNFCSN